ncbi:hypothetical protein BEH_07680 [Priestia filamentosa]|uniref:Uncharacterized protein n=1 Tax=Priestia filamentosa TaxID=1402861 RepID=A0A0H4KEF3_9BACI|nr:hypothetical protein [Priestia filamentosa]AKO91990.1 hypothetical protein BEH_07680 [Priestia filamentosa]
MQAWEVYKNLQEGKQMRLRGWGDGAYIELNEDLVTFTDESGVTGNIDAYLINSDDWEFYHIPRFAVGDLITDGRGRIIEVSKVHKMNDGSYLYTIASDIQKGWKYPFDEWRKATKEEIEQEKEKRKWAKWGREINEFKETDIVLFRPKREVYEVVDIKENGIEIAQGYNSLMIVSCKDLKMIAPRENRVDL